MKLEKVRQFWKVCACVFNACVRTYVNLLFLSDYEKQSSTTMPFDVMASHRGNGLNSHLTRLTSNATIYNMWIRHYLSDE